MYLSDAEAMNAIAELLNDPDEPDWGADQLQAIAELVVATGRTIEDRSEYIDELNTSA